MLPLLGLRLVDGRDDVKPLELGDPLFEAVEAVNRIVALVRALLKHQAVDEFPSLWGRFHGGVRGGRACRLSVGEGEREEHVVAYDTRLDGVEIEVEGRVALGLFRFRRVSRSGICLLTTSYTLYSCEVSVSAP